MDEAQRLKKHKEQTDDIYRSIGQFCVRFELFIHQVGVGIQMILSQKGGLSNQQLSQIIIAEQTAQPLISILQSMVATVCNLSSDEEKICKALFKRMKILIENRNIIVHSTWFVGWASSEDTDFSKVSGTKAARTATGIQHKAQKFTAEDFDKLGLECLEMNKLVTRLWACVIGDHSIANNFVLKADGSVLGIE